jgi:hypothetical protein
MSDREQSDQHETQDENQREADVQGVDTNPDDDKKSIAVDTDERLEGRDDERDFDDIPEGELEKERDERLSAENRPETAEVDNSDRTFNPETGLFEDSDIEPPEGAPFATTEAEQSNTKESKDTES